MKARIHAPVSAFVHELRLAFIALQFLTRLPAPRWVGFEPAWLHQSARHFPLVGALVGLIGAAVLLLAGRLFGPPVAALCAVAATIVTTGAFHEDGLADTFDALGGAVPRERALTIMKDSRIGTYGAVALVLSLLARVGLLATLAAQQPLLAAAALVLAHGWGRAAAVALMAVLPYAGDAEHAKAKPLATAVGVREWATAFAWALALGAAALAAGLPAARVGAAALALGLLLAAMRRWLHRRLGGYTGDTLGAAEQLAELVVLAAMAAVLAR